MPIATTRRKALDETLRTLRARRPDYHQPVLARPNSTRKQTNVINAWPAIPNRELDGNGP